ncbi:MAG: hypothetical protein H6662_03105 [Ardenticatenaceae bacterium]|nr:hypothetical protein [Anaerolineales bacterium]MCB8920549.1 hypothetical protein [Ardenticatenaceae bacterium]MCB8990172.1 hypothetical protein [Ardenticatenaceae bacterium]MCB9003037.1 hypothetical protein [Ardenticatenaceae bacterium]
MAERIATQLAGLDGRSSLDGRSPTNGCLLDLLRREWPAFYLGSVAPDVQTVSGAPRTATHFYDVPPEQGNMAYPRMLVQYPQLADVKQMPLAQAVFVAGYSAHLLLDLVWFREILMPIFVNSSALGEGRQRWMMHHTLLTYLDGLAYASLPETAVNTLAAAHPQHWLPFVTDQDLQTWRDMLTVQLEPDAPLETVAVYAQRLHMTPADFAAQLADEQWMSTHFFALVPVEKVQARLETAVTESISVIHNYLSPLINSA